MKPFLHIMLDLQVLPLGLAEAVNQEDPQSFATSFSSLVRINEGSKALFSAGFGVKESAFSSFWSTGKFPVVERPLLPVVVSHYWRWLLSRPCYLHCPCFTCCRIKKCAWSRALPCQSFTDTGSLRHLVTCVRMIPSLGYIIPERGL